MPYFTYGSFLNIDKLRKLRHVCRALIPDWEAQSNYYSKNYQGGCTGIELVLNRLVRGQSTIYSRTS